MTKSKKNFLVVGGNSEIGRSLVRLFDDNQINYTATTRDPFFLHKNYVHLNLNKLDETFNIPKNIDVACIIAAVARISECENNPEASYSINVLNTINLIDLLIKQGIYCLFLSTNQVFDGSTPYVKAEAPHCPVSEYGKQKSATENYLINQMALGKTVGILRLSKVFSKDTPILKNWKKNVLEGKVITAFNDMCLAPVPIDSVTKAIYMLMNEEFNGIAQLSGNIDLTYFDLAHEFCCILGANKITIQGSSAKEANLGIGAIPRNTTLNSDLVREKFGINIPDLRNMLEMLIRSD